MTSSTPVIFVIKRSDLPSDRPGPGVVQLGELALCTGSGDTGLYFYDTGNDLQKVGTAHYGSVAPNAIPSGATGNVLGELWYNPVGASGLYVFTEYGWVKV